MSYRQSEMYKLTTYLKDLPQQSVSSKKNLQVVDKFRKTCELVFFWVFFEICLPPEDSF